MHDHDLDLIAEHASGLLSEDDAARARELVSSCAVCADEYDLHSQVRTLLASAPLPSLSEFERSRLRRSVLDEVAPPRSAVSPWQRRFLAAAGGIAAVAVMVVGFGVLGQSGGEDTMTVGAEPTETSAPADALVPMDRADSDDAMGTMADEATEESDADLDTSTAEAAARFGGVLVDTGSEPVDLDTVLAEVSAIVAEIGEPVPVEDLVAFGATCAPSLESQIFGAVLADSGSVQVFLVGDAVEPAVEYRATSDCTPIAP